MRFRAEIRSLAREKGRMLATLANALARRRLTEALEGLSVDADMRALDGVREQIARIATEGQLDRELAGSDDGLRVRAARDPRRRAPRGRAPRARGAQARASSCPGADEAATNAFSAAPADPEAEQTERQQRAAVRLGQHRGRDVDEVAVVGCVRAGRAAPG